MDVINLADVALSSIFDEMKFWLKAGVGGAEHSRMTRFYVWRFFNTAIHLRTIYHKRFSIRTCLPARITENRGLEMLERRRADQ